MLQRRVLTDHASIGKFECIMMHMRLVFVDLPEDRRLVADRFRSPTEESGRRTNRLLGKGNFGPRPYTDCNGGIFRRGESARTETKVAGGELVGDLRDEVDLDGNPEGKIMDKEQDEYVRMIGDMLCANVTLLSTEYPEATINELLASALIHILAAEITQCDDPQEGLAKTCQLLTEAVYQKIGQSEPH
jgi:hypothetical protein